MENLLEKSKIFMNGIKEIIHNSRGCEIDKITYTVTVSNVCFCTLRELRERLTEFCNENQINGEIDIEAENYNVLVRITFSKIDRY